MRAGAGLSGWRRLASLQRAETTTNRPGPGEPFGSSPTGCVLVDKLSKSWGNQPVLDGLDLSAGPGECVLILGPNGSGKSTLLLCTAGLTAFQGSVVVNGIQVDPRADQVDLRWHLAYLPDSPALFDDLTVWTHGHFVATVWRLEGWVERFQILLDRFDLLGSRDHLAGTLSRGGRQKLALALAFLHEPSVMFVDEPFVGLDEAGRAAFRDLLADRLNSRGCALVATHEPDELRALAARCLRMSPR